MQCQLHILGATWSVGFRGRMAKSQKDALTLPADLQVDTLIDVGVADGTQWLYTQFPDAQLVLVDPLPAPMQLVTELKDRNVRFHAAAAGATKGTATLHVDLGRASRSSLYQRTNLTRSSNPIQPQDVPIERLDEIAGSPKYGRIGLKIDTEGHELGVLIGSEGLLDRCEFILCEVSIGHRFDGSYSSKELFVWLADHGFSAAELMRSVRSRNNEPLFADVLFRPNR